MPRIGKQPKPNRATNLITFRLREDAFISLDELDYYPSKEAPQLKLKGLTAGTKCQKLIYYCLGIDENDNKTVYRGDFKDLVNELIADRMFKVLEPKFLAQNKKIEKLEERIKYLEDEQEIRHPSVNTVKQIETDEHLFNNPLEFPIFGSQDVINTVKQDIIEETETKETIMSQNRLDYPKTNFLTSKELAEKLGISEQWLNRHRDILWQDYKFYPEKEGNRWRYYYE